MRLEKTRNLSRRVRYTSTPSDALQIMVPSIRPLDARSVWCQAKISVDQAMMVSTMLLVLGQLTGLVEVTEPVEGLKGAVVVVG